MNDGITMGEKYHPAMTITEQGKADAYFEACVVHTMRVRPCGREEAEAIERGNIGYYAGYYDGKTQARVLKLYAAKHPIFD